MLSSILCIRWAFFILFNDEMIPELSGLMQMVVFGDKKWMLTFYNVGNFPNRPWAKTLSLRN